jgi:hypothetical protein
MFRSRIMECNYRYLMRMSNIHIFTVHLVKNILFSVNEILVGKRLQRYIYKLEIELSFLASFLCSSNVSVEKGGG